VLKRSASGVHFNGGPCVKGPLVINFMNEKKANSNRVKTHYSESFLKEQSHFVQLKEQFYKNVKGKKGL
jgi:hypothetical protein